MSRQSEKADVPWGIYDDTPDLHRAIAVSDAYFGSWSSLVPLFTATGKPVMIQDMKVLSGVEESVNPLLFESCYDDGENIWFAACLFNGAFKCNKTTWDAEYLGCFPGEKKDGIRLFSSVAQCNGKLYFAPMSAESIGVYDIAGREFSRIEIKAVDEDKHSGYCPDSKFAHAICCDDNDEKIILVSALYPAILVIDGKTRRVTYVTDWLTKLESIRHEMTWYFYGCIAVDGDLFITARCANAVAIFRSNKMECEICELGADKISYNGICYDGKDLWLACCQLMKGRVMLGQWNHKRRQRITWVEVLALEEGTEPEDMGYGMIQSLICRNGNIYIVPYHMNKALKFNIETGSVTVFAPMQPECETPAKVDFIFNKYTAVWQDENMLYALGAGSGKIIAVNTLNDQYHTMKLTGDTGMIRAKAFVKGRNRDKEAEDLIYGETGWFDGEVFAKLQWIFPEKDLEEEQLQLQTGHGKDGKASVGDSIYEYCKSLIL